MRENFTETAYMLKYDVSMYLDLWKRKSKIGNLVDNPGRWVLLLAGQC